MNELPKSLAELAQCRRPLLLQGPMGPFFAQLADWLLAHGQTVHKVQFNGGDCFFYRGRSNTHNYTGRHGDLGGWLSSMLALHRIDAVVLFGQHRPVHEVARAVAAHLGLKLFVFEEGYLRPDYVTLEQGGVNGCSGVPRDPKQFRLLGDVGEVTPPSPTDQRFSRMAWYAILYSMAMLAMRARFRGHIYHRPFHPLAQALAWVRGGLRKGLHAWSQRNVLSTLSAPARHGRYFLLPLQVHNDSQIVCHSPYEDMEAVVDEVVASFARHADAGDWLVIKHHPMDRAYRDYGAHIRQTASAMGVADRVVYVHDLHLPTLLRHARGVVTVNSTTGLQALYHRIPVATLGTCFYAVPGLVHGGSLASFWRDPGAVDRTLFQQFRHFLVRHNQLNASFYGCAPVLVSNPAPTREPDAVPAMGDHARPAGVEAMLGYGGHPASLPGNSLTPACSEPSLAEAVSSRASLRLPDV